MDQLQAHLRPLPQWPPKLPASRPFEPSRCAITPRAHQFVSGASAVGSLGAYHRWVRRDWSSADKLAMGGALEAILCDLAVLVLTDAPAGPKYLTVVRPAVAQAQAYAPASGLALFPDALMHLIGCGFIASNSHDCTPGSRDELGFEPRAGLLEAVARLGLGADDFGRANSVLRTRNVVRLP